MDWIFLVIAVISGVLLGIIYFGGLWLTIRHLAERGGSPWLLAGSFLVRTVFLLSVFYALVIYHWAYLMVALAAFLAVRQVALKRLRKSPEALYN